MSIMFREIAEQPEALDRTLRSELPRMVRLASFLKSRDLRLIVLVARGTSDNAALFGRYLLEISTGIPVSLSAPSVHTLYRKRLKLRDALVVGISQSGEGADVNAVLESCKRSGAHVLAITNHSRSSMAGIVHEAFVTRAGMERSVAATKTYTCQLMLLHMLADTLSGGNCEPLRRIPDYAQAALGLSPRIESIIERYRFMDRCAVVGRGLNYANAYELAIKLMETCYIIAERFSAADFLHGPIAMVQRDFPVMLFAPPGKVLRDMRVLISRLKELQADMLVISSEKTALNQARCAIEIPASIPELYSAIPYIIPGQIFAEKLSLLKGLSPDRPRSLTKVTSTR
ncbi:MAG: SIS domain-containing protein [Acidobacteriia bacterium]|nr:SIS domain-containing protein [Terriglobia bacterium]